MKPNKLLILSLDALNYHDFDTLKQLPNIGKFFSEGAYVRKVSSVYPSLTYTCHTSIGTGHYPATHGIYNNEYAQPEQPTTQDWRWFEKDIQSPTFFDYAKQAGLSTATVLWPVMASATTKYNVPEIWSPDHSIPSYKLILGNCTKNVIWPILKYARLTKGTSQPYLDNFTEKVSLHILKKHRPDVMAVHLTELDTFRHLDGLHGPRAATALRSLDQRVGHLLAQVKANGDEAHTNIVLLGDHGTHDFTQVIEVNSFFINEGLLTVDSFGHIQTWQAYACTCGGSCHIHLNHGADDYKALLEKVATSLEKLVASHPEAIKSVINAQEAAESFKLSGDFEFILEAMDTYAFRNGLSGQLFHDRSLEEKPYYGDHGYLPTHQDMATMLLMKGPDIKKGAVLETATLVDEGPTFAHLLGTNMEKVEGRILHELLN